MLKTVIPERHRERLKLSQSEKGKKLGKCLLCGERVRTKQDYITTSEGYTHKECLKSWKSQ